MMNRFVIDGLLSNIELPSEFSEDFEHHLTIPDHSKAVGSLADTLSPAHSSSSDHVQSEWTLNSDIILPSHRTRYAFSDELMQEVKALLSNLYSISPSIVQVSRDCWKYKSIQMHGKQLGSHLSRSRASSIVMAMWKSDLFGCPSELEESPLELLRAARVNQFLIHTVNIDGVAYTHLLVCLSWYRCHPKMLSLGKPLSVWSNNFELCHNIVPVQFVKHRVISLSTKLDNECVLIACPCVEF